MNWYKYGTSLGLFNFVLGWVLSTTCGNYAGLGNGILAVICFVVAFWNCNK